MTREVSKAAIDAMTDADLLPIVTAFSDLKTSAVRAGVPHAIVWQLDHRVGGPTPWRIVDRRADPGSDGGANIAITLQATTSANLHIELTAYGKALRGICEIRHSGYSPLLMAAARR